MIVQTPAKNQMKHMYRDNRVTIIEQVRMQ